MIIDEELALTCWIIVLHQQVIHTWCSVQVRLTSRIIEAV